MFEMASQNFKITVIRCNVQINPQPTKLKNDTYNINSAIDDREVDITFVVFSYI